MLTNLLKAVWGGKTGASMLVNLMTALDECCSSEEMQQVLGMYEDAEKIRVFAVPGKYFGDDETAFIIGENIPDGEKRSPESFMCLLIERSGISPICGREGLSYINSVTEAILRDIDADEQENPIA